MALKKHGTGQILPDEEDQQKTASQDNWDPKDERELSDEQTED